MRKTCAFLLLFACLAAGQDKGSKRDLRAGGGSKATTSAVTSSLGWFRQNQRPDGGWGDTASQPATTGLALLSLVGAGYTDRGAVPNAKVVRDGARYLMVQQQNSGAIGADVRGHAIATLALSELYWMTKNPRYKKPAQSAVTWLVKQPLGDPVTTAWTVMAMKSARHGKLNLGTATFPKLAAGDGRAMAISVMTRIFAGEKAQSAGIRKDLTICLGSPPGDDRLYWYFGTLAMFQAGGSHWKQWNKAMKDAIVKTQEQDGSWKPLGKPDETYGRTGETALMTMCLEVYYRYDRVFGLSDAPFTGPTTNSAIGIGGAAGGAFRGRGGRRNLRAGGGRAIARYGRPGFHTEGYDRIDENPFRTVSQHDTSTFSIDVDTASYANVRRFLLKDFKLPPKDAVRIEELLNYFPYDYAPPAADSEHPFAAQVDVAACPWNEKHRLVRIALKGKEMAATERPATNLVFLLDVSGSMRSHDKLPLLKQAMALLVQHLGARDRVAIAVYAGAAGLILPPTPCDEKDKILAAIGRLAAGGSTAGGEGIQLAYRVAAGSFIEGGVNRVVLCTDGDFNVGVTDHGSLTRMIEQKAKSGVYLSVLGFGSGNVKDDLMEQLSNRGNGNYAYVDTIAEARKVLVHEMSGTLVTIAKDVKIQVFFNPARVAGYRLIGYENRMLSKKDFNDDKKDAGEIGAGHTVTALYEIIPAGAEVPGAKADDNPFVRRAVAAGESEALFRLRLRYKLPEATKSVLMERDVFDKGGEASAEFRWAAAVAQFGMLLRNSPHKGETTWDAMIELAKGAKGADPHGYRTGFLEMANAAKRLSAVQGN